MKAGCIYLIPTPISEDVIEKSILKFNIVLINELRLFAVEDIRTSRRFLRKINSSFPIDDSEFQIINKKSSTQDVFPILDKVKKGISCGIMSEAGCPGIADPGSILVAEAQNQNIPIIPLVGPSSIFLALMASGFNGQNFRFSGYIPKERAERIKTLRNFENLAKRETQIFMDTPFRNMNVLEDLIKTLNPNTKLCIALDVTGEKEQIKTQTIKAWASTKIDLNKIPCLFLIGS